jgi:hypothetical protein
MKSEAKFSRKNLEKLDYEQMFILLGCRMGHPAWNQ